MTAHTKITFAGNNYVETRPTALGRDGLTEWVALDGLTGSQLVSLHNLVASNLGRAAVKRFADTATAAKRTWKLLAEWADQPEEVVVVTPAEAPAQFKLVKNVDGGKTVVLNDADKREVRAEAEDRKEAAVGALMKVASVGAAQTQLRTAPPASDNPAKDAEMPALRKALRPMALEPKNRVYARKAGSKQAILVDLLSRPEGATFGELYDGLAATGKPWKGVTIRSGLAWDINHIAGYGVKSELFNGVEFAEQGRHYEAKRLGVVQSPNAFVANTWTTSEGYDPELKLAVFRLAYPAGMDAPLDHLVAPAKKG